MKRIVKWTIVISMIFQSAAPITFAAEGDSVAIKGGSKLRARSTLKAEVTPSDGNFTYQWTSADTDAGEYLPILGANGREYKLSTIDAEKYIGLTATNVEDGETTVSNITRTMDTLGPVNKTSFTDNAVSDAKFTSGENIFTVDGQSFILLGEYNSNTSKYFVMTEESYGEMPFDTNAYARFDVNEEGNIGYFLNNTFISDGYDGKKLPDDIINYIDTNHKWWTESGLSVGDSSEDYSFNAGISLLSASEADVFYGIYGWQPDGESGNWWLRTQRGSGTTLEDNIFVMSGIGEATKGNIIEKSCTDSYMIRPVFYLNNSFFEDVKLDVSKTGTAIGDVLKRNYTTEQLESLYTEPELIKLGIKEIEFELDLSSTKQNNGTTLTAELKNLRDQNLTDVTYQWVYKTSEDDEFKPIYKENSNTYKISTEDAGRIISVEAIPEVSGNKKNMVAATKYHTVASFGLEPRVALGAAVKAESETTPKENLFTVDGEKFILLNEYDDEDSAFFIMTEDLYGTRMYDEDKTEKFDIEDENNIGYFLNNEFIIEGNQNKKLPQDIIDHINFNHVWYTEGGWAKSNCPTDYTFTAGISLISKSQYVKYFGKFGWNKGPTEANQWWTRTSRGKDNDNTTNILCAIGNTDGGDLWNRLPDSVRGIRPVFYLDRDFFKNVKVKDAGENVIKAIADKYSFTELMEGRAGYTFSELESLGIIVRPEASDVSLSGNGAVNCELFGNYTYISDKEENDSEVGFEISTDNLNFINLKKDSLSYKVTESDKGKYIRFYCIPKDFEGISGEKVVSESIKITYEQDITVSTFTLQGKSLSGVKIITPQFTLVNNSSEEKSAVCIIAAYDKDNHIIKTNIENIALSGNGEKTVTDFNMAKPTDAKYARVFIVDDLLRMNSLLGYEVVLR